MFDDPSLLVVDDEEAICEGCRRIFSRQGFQVDNSTDAQEGLRLAAERNYSAVLLDIKMPEIDGFQFLEALHGTKPDIPVILITGYPSVSSAAAAVRLGASDYVVKPFTPEEITQSVQTVLTHHHAKTIAETGSVSLEAEPWFPRAGEFRFLNESWFQLGKEGSVRAGAMHQQMPYVPMSFEGSMRVGAFLTPREAATVEAVHLPEVGEVIYQGLPLARLSITGKSQRIVPSPLSGVVVAINRLLRESPSALWEDPCGDGWMACVSPTRFEEDVKKCKLRRAVLANACPVSARSQREELKRLGCQVRVATKWEELGPAVQDSNYNVLVLDADSFGEDGPELVGRVNSEAPSMKIVVVASSRSQWEPAYRERKILYYAVEPFSDDEILEILDAAFRRRQQPASQGRPGRVSSEPIREIPITNCSGHRVHALTSPGLPSERGGFGERATDALPEHIVREPASTDNLPEASRNTELTNEILRQRLDTILSSFAGEESELIPILQRVQAEFSCLPDEAMRAIAQFTGVSESRVYSVATFYEQFHLTPVGKKHVMACRGASCYLRGGPQILNALEEQLGIKVGETTQDLEYSLGTIGCTGTCALSPCIMINDKVESKMTPHKVAKLFGKSART